MKVLHLILNKSSYHRSPAEINLLRQALVENSFFAEMASQSNYLLERCLRRLQYQFVPQGTYLFREGDAGDRFYIILSGSVTVHKVIASREVQLTILHAGDSFGELALIRQAPRTASVRGCYCHLAVLLAEDYSAIHKIFKNIQKKLYFEEFSSLSVFAGWNETSIKMIFDNIQQVNCGMNYNLYREGEESTSVFIIQQGEVRMEKIITNEQMVKKKMILKLLNEGSMFGEAEIIQNTKREQTAVTNQLQNKLFRISRNEFMKVLKVDINLRLALENMNIVKGTKMNEQVQTFEQQILKPKQQKLQKYLSGVYYNPMVDDDAKKVSNMSLERISNRKDSHHSDDSIQNSTQKLRQSRFKPMMSLSPKISVSNYEFEDPIQMVQQLQIKSPLRSFYKDSKNIKTEGQEAKFELPLVLQNNYLRVKRNILF